MNFLFGKKLKMTQVWQDQRVVPVTVIKVDPLKISIIRQMKKDGYAAVQLNAGRVKREFRLPASSAIEVAVGQTVDVSVFQAGDKVQVSGLSRGRGFQGVVKRYNFGGGPKTHGQKNRLRAPGSIGSTAPQRVVPGRRMAGHMGTERVTLKNMEVTEIDAQRNLLLLKGAVPGASGTLIEIRKAQ